MKIPASLFTQLQNLGAGEFTHLNGSLENHLIATEQLLAKWEARSALRRAGLFHAAYGTAGYGSALAPLSLREQIAELVGEEAERLIYTYCACDRSAFFPRLGTQDQCTMPNRFTGEATGLSQSELADFCELTAANEIEIAVSGEAFRRQHGASLLALFRRMGDLLSAKAHAAAEAVLADVAQP